MRQRYLDAKAKNSFWYKLAEDVIDISARNRARYEAVAKETGFHWCVVAVIHSLESNQNFTTHLHNGDPLTARTVQVPAGRPLKGNPPFTWQESAIDALKGYSAPEGLEDTLDFLERYNGLGYRTGAGVNTTPPKTSPYLWSGTDQYVKGKYVADGAFDGNAVSQQIGAVLLLKTFERAGLIEWENQNVAEPTWWAFHRNEDGKPSLVGYAGSVPVSRLDTNLVDAVVKALQFSKAKTFVVSEKTAPDLNVPEKPQPEKPQINRQKIAEEARARCSKGRSHSPGNVIDTEVLDPLRPTMKRLGQMAQSDNDGFYNWCASNVTRILRDCGLTVPDQPIVNGKPFWATVALVETWKAWAIDKGAWRNSRQAEPGDIVIYDWDGNGVTDHIGIILETRESGVLAAEGNKGNRETIIYRDRSTFAGTINVDKLFNLNS